MRQLQSCNKGISIIEILISSFVIGSALVSILGLAAFSLTQSLIIKQTAVATALAQDLMEATRNFRDNTTWNTNGLGTLGLGVAYYAQKSSSPVQWQMIQGTETVNGFSRNVTLGLLARDGNSNIVLSGGVTDPNAKKITVSVLWSERGRNHQVQLIDYVTNWRQ